MTNRYLTVIRTVFVALIVTAIVCAPVSAQQTIEDHRNATSGLAARDATALLRWRKLS